MKKNKDLLKIKDYLLTGIPFYGWTAIFVIIALNIVVYYGNRIITDHMHHFDISSGLDKKIPFVPFFILVYIIVAYSQWWIGYLISAKEDKKTVLFIFGSESIAEQKATLTLIGKLHEAGLEPDDDALDTISERIGFGIRRAAPPPSPMLPFSASIPIPGVPTSLAPTTVPLSAGDSVDDRPAAARADDLTRAFAADLAPIKDLIAASTSPDDCIRRVEAWVVQHNPSNAAEVIEKALYVYSMAGARSAQRPTTRRPKS